MIAAGRRAQFTKSIAWVEQGVSGIYLKGVFEHLGVAGQIKGKLISVKSAGQAVANGEAEIGFTQVSEVLPYAGAEAACCRRTSSRSPTSRLASATRIPSPTGARSGDQAEGT
jgi:ABC-type molybdate transport system substrate-binding protein